ncbi:MAG: energy coupling factor transporter S component ThiW [bacterium]
MTAKTELRKLVYTALLSAMAIALSSFMIIPVGPTKVQPIQHAMNVIAGVLLGPWYAALGALVVGLVRNALGTGTLFAFPGGIPGALVVGLAYKYIKRDWVGLLEPIGTGPIGATISYFIVAPLIGKTGMTLWFFQMAFLASSIPGSVLGLLAVLAIKRWKVDELIKLRAPTEPTGTSK